MADPVENVAMFLAFQVQGHDESWSHVSPQLAEVYRDWSEALVQLARAECTYDELMNGDGPTGREVRG